jgi:hypothetical protein
MRFYFAVVVILISIAPGSRAAAQEPREEPPKLLGRCTAEQLMTEPFSEWYVSGHDSYSPNPEIVRALVATDRTDIEMTLFFGTWCGDSRREVPRLYKLFDTINLPEERVQLIALDSAEGARKTSPGGEQRGQEIYRVPTLIVRRSGEEIGRIVESPVLSLERDLLAILSGAPYEPNYRSYPVIHRWLAEGLLADPNVSAWGLAGLLRNLVVSESELAAAATTLLERGQVAEGVKLAEANCALYRESARCFGRLADAWIQAGDLEAARKAARRALRLDPDREQVEALSDLLEHAGKPPEDD